MQITTRPTTSTSSGAFKLRQQLSPNVLIPRTPTNKFRIQSPYSSKSINYHKSQPNSPRITSKAQLAVQKSSKAAFTLDSKANENQLLVLTPTSHKKPLEAIVSLPVVAEDTYIQGRKETAKVFTQKLVGEKNEILSEIR